MYQGHMIYGFFINLNISDAQCTVFKAACAIRRHDVWFLCQLVHDAWFLLQLGHVGNRCTVFMVVRTVWTHNV